MSISRESRPSKMARISSTRAARAAETRSDRGNSFLMSMGIGSLRMKRAFCCMMDAPFAIFNVAPILQRSPADHKCDFAVICPFFRPARGQNLPNPSRGGPAAGKTLIMPGEVKDFFGTLSDGILSPFLRGFRGSVADFCKKSPKRRFFATNFQTPIDMVGVKM